MNVCVKIKNHINKQNMSSMIANTETKAFIEVKMKRELTETEYDKKWEDLSMIYENL